MIRTRKHGIPLGQLLFWSTLVVVGSGLVEGPPKASAGPPAAEQPVVEQPVVEQPVAAPPADDDSPRYSTRIRPLLSRCVACHGPDPDSRAADLRLDSFEEATRDLGDYQAIVPGDPGSSELIRRIEESDPDLVMPPPGHGEPLDPDAIALLKKWIADGARFESHWSYLPPVRPEVPPVDFPQGSRHPVDAFVFQRLQSSGLQPNPEADRAALLRRASLDLTGLPPSAEFLREFLNDPAPDWWSRAVDRLLADPAYGERWAAVWLDLARYADSQGYSSDALRTIWPYRDYVIRSFNENKPFDRFTIEQLAGDLLPNAGDEELIATAFHRNTLTNTEGGTDDEEFRNAAVVDRVNTTFAVWMGTTMACAQCHTHKYDPLTQLEYFRFFDILNQTADNDQPDDGPLHKVYSPADLARRSELEQEISRRSAELDGQLAGDLPLQALLAQRRLDGSRELPDAMAVRVELPGENRILSLAEVVIESGGVNLARAGQTLQSSLDPSFPAPADWAIDGNTNGDFAGNSVTHTRSEKNPWWQVLLPRPSRIDSITIHNRTGNDLHRRLDGAVVRILDGSGRTIWQSSPVTGSAEPVRLAVGSFPPGIKSLLERRRESWNSTESEAVLAFAKEALQATSPMAWQLQKLQRELASLEPSATVPVMRELPDSQRRATHLQIRGSFLQTGERVTAGTPAIFPPLPQDARPDRLGVARWLVDRSNPLTARVIVNRYWEQLFGIGIVETSEEFGSQGELPSHPELLDWLAIEFMDSGWDTKHLLRLLVTSATYRQSSLATPEKLEQDRFNRLLARGPRVRLSAEMVRDQALAVSGLLSRKLGGPPVHPPKPDLGLRLAFSSATTDWQTSTGEDRYRRAIYTELRRSMPYPSLATFDSPNREVCEVRRIATNTPLQALVTLNDPVYLEAARALAERLLSSNPSAEPVSSRAATALETCLQRPAASSEVAVLGRMYEAARAGFTDDEAVRNFLRSANGEPPADPDQARELAAWTTVANVVMNLDEFLQKR